MTYAETYGSADLAEASSLREPSTRPVRRARGGRRLERFEMRILVVMTYPLFLGVAVLSRLGLRRSGFNATVYATPRSVFAEARETAEATIPSAFQG